MQTCWRRFKQVKEQAKQQTGASLEAYRQEKINRNVKCLKAMASFREIRLAKKYIESDSIDLTDVGIKQSAIESDVGYVCRRIENMEMEQRNFQQQLTLTNEKLDYLRWCGQFYALCLKSIKIRHAGDSSIQANWHLPKTFFIRSVHPSSRRLIKVIGFYL